MSVSQADAAKLLLQLKRASLSYGDFLDYYRPEWKRASFQQEYIEVLDLLEKDAFVNAAGNPIRNILVTMPPRHAKSEYGTIHLPAYLLGKKPHREVMVSSYNNDMAATFGRKTREIVADKRFLRAFSALELSKTTSAVDFWKTSKGGAYYGVGLSGTTTGRGANFLFIDDPFKTREEADSLSRRRKVWDFYSSSLSSRLQPDLDGQPPVQIVVLTRWHPDDLAGRIMELPEWKRGEWYHLNFQALKKVEHGVYVSRSSLPKSDPRYVPPAKELGQKTGQTYDTKTRTVANPQWQALWPERFPVDVLLKIKERNERDFASLYQQEPYIVGGNLVKESWFQRYKFEDLPTEFHTMILTADTAFKAKQSNDYSVFTLGGITDTGDIYVIRVWREKLEFPELKKKAITLYGLWRGKGLRALYVEDAASGQSLIQELRSGTPVTVIPWKPGSQDKVARANMVTPLIEGGRVFIPESADWLEDWMDEIVSFPASKNDDQVDAFVQLLDVLSKVVVVGTATFNQPLSTYLREEKAITSELAFTGKPLEADPKGWAAGFGNDLKVNWKGWGQ